MSIWRTKWKMNYFFLSFFVASLINTICWNRLKLWIHGIKGSSMIQNKRLKYSFNKNLISTKYLMNEIYLYTRMSWMICISWIEWLVYLYISYILVYIITLYLCIFILIYCYTCVFIYLCIFILVYFYTSVLLYFYIFILLYFYTCVFIYLYIFILVHLYIYFYICICTLEVYTRRLVIIHAPARGIESPIAKRFLETGTSSTREGTRSVPEVFIVWCRIAKTDSPANTSVTCWLVLRDRRGDGVNGEKRY